MAEASPDRQEDRPVKRSLSGELLAAGSETATPPAKRQCVSPGSSSTGSTPKFYRLDFLWGKSEKKEAQRPIAEPAKQLVALEEGEAQAEAAQTDARAVVLQRKPGGRPRGRKGKSLLPGVRKKKAEPTARAKLQLARELESLKQQPEMSRSSARKKLQKQYQVSKSMISKLEKAGERERLQAFCHARQMGLRGRQRKGSHLKKNKVASQSQGKRIAKPGKTLGKTDHCRVVWQQTAMWAQREEQCGHLLSQTDLMRDYQHRLTLAEESGEQRKRKAGEAWTDQEERQLAAWKKKRQTLANNKKMRSKDGDKLAARAGLRARMCQQTQNISSEEAAERMLVGWRLYDYALWRASQAEVQPDLPVREPAQWVVQYRHTDLTFSDQIPVWLRPSPGRLLTSTVRLEQGLQASKARKASRKAKAAAEAAAQEQQQQQLAQAEEAEGAKEQEAEQRQEAKPVQTARFSPGTAPRWRVSFIARQAISQFFQPEAEPVGVVRPSILVVYGQHCRLENISEAGRWVETERFVFAGEEIVREAGERAHPGLMRTWRKLRSERPDLFQTDKLRVWSQPSAVVDSVVYSWQQRLEAEEAVQAVDQIDCFVGGWTSQADEVAMLTYRLRTAVPASLTGQLQLTDVGLAQPAKASLQRYLEELKDRMPSQSQSRRSAPNLQSQRDRHPPGSAGNA